MKLAVRGMGLWARGFTSADALAAAPPGRVWPIDAPDSPTATAPRPAAVAPKELRRLPAPARLGVQVAVEACDAGGVGADRPQLVFCSAIADSAITDYMCATLAGDDKLLSPLKFQNSVHNAPAGCLSIAVNNRQSTSFVGAFERSAAVAVLECAALLAASDREVLLVATDVPVPGPLADVHGPGELAGAALLFARDDAVDRDRPAHAASLHVALRGVAAVPDAAAAAPDRLGAVAQLWPLLDAFAHRRSLSIALAVGAASTLSLELEPNDGSAG